MVGLPGGEKIEDTCNRSDTILACDRQTERQTDGRTPCHGIVRAMHTRRAVKSSNLIKFGTQQQTWNSMTDMRPNTYKFFKIENGGRPPYY